MYNSIVKIFLLLCMTVHVVADVWNNPHDSEKIKSQTLFSAFSTPPKRLDPVVSYNANEWAIIGQIYEPPLQYNYLKRPYELEALTLKEMPVVTYFDVNGILVDENDDKLAFSEYRLTLREDVKYQDHPSFVKDAKGKLFYGKLSGEKLENIHTLEDFEKQATRNLAAGDYAYAIKRGSAYL